MPLTHFFRKSTGPCFDDYSLWHRSTDMHSTQLIATLYGVECTSKVNSTPCKVVEVGMECVGVTRLWSYLCPRKTSLLSTQTQIDNNKLRKKLLLRSLLLARQFIHLDKYKRWSTLLGAEVRNIPSNCFEQLKVSCTSDRLLTIKPTYTALMVSDNHLCVSKYLR